MSAAACDYKKVFALFDQCTFRVAKKVKCHVIDTRCRDCRPPRTAASYRKDDRSSLVVAPEEEIVSCLLYGVGSKPFSEETGGTRVRTGARVFGGPIHNFRLTSVIVSGTLTVRLECQSKVLKSASLAKGGASNILGPQGVVIIGTALISATNCRHVDVCVGKDSRSRGCE
jgi:hypothetical protein